MHFFTPNQRRLIFMVLCLVGMVLGSVVLSRCRNRRGESLDQTFSEVISQKDNRQKSPSYYATPEQKIESFQFDPNLADSTQLLRLGLAPFQVRSIYRYRAKGGRFTCVDDFRRVYRLTNEQWQHLSPLIRISEKYQTVALVNTHDSRSYVGGDDSLRATYPKKLTGDATVNINTADSATLCRIPGIGAYNARRVVRYRKQLGGFVSTSQLLALEEFPADALAWMEVGSSPSISRIDINHITQRRLMHHPYFGYYRASEVISYRKVHGPLKSIEDLRSLPHFTSEDIQRITPYLEFK